METPSGLRRCRAALCPRASARRESFVLLRRELCESDARVRRDPRLLRREGIQHSLNLRAECSPHRQREYGGRANSFLPECPRTPAESFLRRAARPASAPDEQSVRSASASTYFWASKWWRVLWVGLQQESRLHCGPFS